MADRRRTVLAVTDRNLADGARGNTRRIGGLLRRLRALGCRVVLAAPAERCQGLPAGLADEVVPVAGPVFLGGDPTTHDTTAFGDAVARICARERVDAVLAEYIWLAPCLAAAPGETLRVVDTHDVFHERSAVDDWVTCTAETEAALLAHADAVLAIHDRDAATLRRLAGDRVRTVPHVAADEPAHYRPSAGAELMFVGCRHAGNRGIVDFVAHSWPDIRAARPEATLHIYGEVRDWLEPVPGCQLAGVVDDRALAAAYARAAAVLAPITAGSGLKIKVVEALHHGRAVVATPFAVRGMPAPRSTPWALADGWPAFTRAAVGLLANTPERHRMELEGRRYAHDEYGVQRVDAALSAVLAARPAPVGVV